MACTRMVAREISKEKFMGLRYILDIDFKSLIVKTSGSDER